MRLRHPLLLSYINAQLCAAPPTKPVWAETIGSLHAYPSIVDMPPKTNDVATISYVPGTTEVEVLSARWSEHEFPRHCHHTYVIEVVLAGRDEFLCGHRTLWAQPGDIVFLHPGEVHTGRSAGEVPLEYEALYPSSALMSRLAEEVGRPSPPTFRRNVVRDPELAVRLCEAMRRSQWPDGKQSIEEALRETIVRHALMIAADGVREQPLAVRQIKELVKADPSRNHRLEDLAEHCGFSPFHLVRMFKAAVGLPPHEYLHAYRAELAREMLRAGRSARAASDFLGYADQAHFTRKFRQIVGVNPGRFRRKPGL